jgi:hypothetical protein
VATKREALGADDAETAVTTSELGLVLLVGAAVVLAAIVAAKPFFPGAGFRSSGGASASPTMRSMETGSNCWSARCWGPRRW